MPLQGLSKFFTDALRAFLSLSIFLSVVNPSLSSQRVIIWMRERAKKIVRYIKIYEINDDKIYYITYNEHNEKMLTINYF